jgi:hypothetical protein
MAATKITSRVLADDAVVRATLGDDAIGTAEIADDAITSALVADDIALGGNPTTTTQSASNSTTRIATTAFVQAAVDADINALIDSAPGTMNTLDEIAAALNDDPSFTTTVNNAIALKAPIANPVFTGNATFDSPTLYVDSSNNRVGIGDTTPSYTLDVAGTLRATGTITGDVTGAVTGNASTATALATARTIGGTSFDGTANIAVGLAGTATALATARTIGMTGDVVWTSPSFDGSGNVTAAGTIQTDAVDIAMLSASGTASSSTYLRGDNSWAAVSSFNADQAQTFNESGASVDFRVESNNQSHMFFVDGSEDKIGIGTNTPAHMLNLVSSGDAGIHIMADSDNSGEGDNPYLSMSQDGSSAQQLIMGIESNVNTQFTGSLANSPFIRANNHADQPFQIAHMDSVVATFRSGEVGIGTQSPLGKLHVKEDDSGGTVNSNFDQLVLEDDAHSGMTILSGTSHDGGIYFGDSGGNNLGQFKYKHLTNAFEFATNNGSAALTIASDDQVGIGTTTPSARLHIDGMTAGEMAFYIEEHRNDVIGGAAALAYINITDQYAPFAGFKIAHAGTGSALDVQGITTIKTKAGAVQVLTGHGASSTSTAAHFQVPDNGNIGFGRRPQYYGSNKYMDIGPASTNGACIVQLLGHNSAIKLNLVADTTKGFVYTESNSDLALGRNQTAYFTINSSGVMAGDFNDTSDINLKENIQSITASTAIIKQLRPVTFDWKEITHKNNKDEDVVVSARRNKAGFIAQEVEIISGLEHAVTGTDYVDGTDIVESKSLDTLTILAHAIKTIQELEARITTLEG